VSDNPIGGWAVNGEPITWAQSFQATGMCLGVAIFSLADARDSPKFSGLGVLMATGSVAASAVTGNMQKRAMVSSKKQMQGFKVTAEEPTSAVLRGKGAMSPKSKGER
jgi:drug/metabolite transporter (DMT)-like permease